MRWDSALEECMLCRVPKLPQDTWKDKSLQECLLRLLFPSSKSEVVLSCSTCKQVNPTVPHHSLLLPLEGLLSQLKSKFTLSSTPLAHFE